MRKVKYLVANSLDNFIARPDGAVDWLFNDDTDYGMAEFFRSIDCILLGRKTYEFAIGHSQPQRKSPKAKRKATQSWGMKTYVFSRTINAGPDDDFTVVSENAGDLCEDSRESREKIFGLWAVVNWQAVY